MNTKGLALVRSAYLSNIGRSMADWYAALGEFMERSEYGQSGYKKSFACQSIWLVFTIQYHPDKGWTADTV